MKKILQWTWCLPQTLLGYIYYKLSDARKVIDYKESKVVFGRKVYNGISLGRYILLNDKAYPESNDYTQITIKHEYGHCVQSYIFGPLYLIVIGLPSVIHHAIGHSLYHLLGTWDYFDDYYERYPENWADKLGRVSRE